MTEPQLPHDFEAERAVIAAMLGREEAIDEAMAHLVAEDWHEPRHRDVFEAIVELSQLGEQVEPVRVLQAIRAKGRGDIETSGFLVELMGDALIADVEGQAKRLAAIAKQRALLLALKRLVAMGYTAEPDQWVETVERTVQAVADREIGAASLHFDEQLRGVLDTLAEREKPQGDKGYWATDWTTLNRLVHGWSPGVLYILAATPGIGKTSFALQQAWKLAGQQFGDETLAVVFFSMEMTHTEIVERALSQAALVPNEAMKSGKINGYWGELTSAAALIGQRPILIDDTPALSVVDVRSRTRRAMAKLRRKHPTLKLRLAMIVCDHVQLMSGQGDNRNQQVAGITGGLAKCAKDLGCAVVALSQMNRTQQKDKFRRPVLADLRDSGAIEADANTVVFLYAPDAQKSEERGPETTAIVAKNRGGRTGDAPLHFKGDCTLFTVPEHSPEFETGYAWDPMGGR